jgi:hypothetical protein
MVAEDIARFCGCFEQQIQAVTSLQDQSFDKVYPCILWVTIMDSLSKAGLPQCKRHRERVIGFIDTYVQWVDRDRVSLIQMELQLGQCGRGRGRLYEHAAERIFSWPEGLIVAGAQVDPQLQEIESLVSNDSERRITEKCCYKELLYSHRNSLIHECRQPGRSVQCFSSDKDYAFYHGTTDYAPRPGDPEERDKERRIYGWELVFPWRLFRSLCSKGLATLKEVLEQNKANPYLAYDFSRMWKNAE